ncbi:hybrid NRPS/PKS enzyme, putative [Aspergillus lentulus]|nr:hybrid NRPS/PKS enzyme, putative [Aspergillus lentulus]GFF95698.1 hybrid NRPS/PKS enzyme, putative [Aspergillus lentulus]
MLIRLVDVGHLSIGISSANRYRKDMSQSVGLYLNLLPLRFTPQMDHTFTNILHIVREKSLNAFAHSKVPFDVIVNELGVPRSASHSPLSSCESTATAFEQGQAPYDVSLDIIDNPDGECHVIIAGQSVLYDAQHVDVLGRVYRNLLTVFARNPALRFEGPALYEAEEVKCPVYKYKWPETIPERVDIMVQRYGTHVALIDGNGRKTTYTQMDQRVNSLAMALLKRGAGPGSRIGVFMEPRSDWICSLLATLRLYAIYIPLDSRMGLVRLATIAQDCKPDLVLVNNISASDIASLKTPGSSVNVDQIFSRSDDPKVPNAARPSSTAVIMYTSGSTGVPKGILMQHQTFRNIIETSTDKWDFRDGSEIALQQSSYSFDMSLSQTFLALSNGGTLRIVAKQLRGDPQAISPLIATEGITFTKATPSEYISWLRYGDTDGLRHSSRRVAVSGGEAVTDTLILAFRQLEKSDLELIDCYGPTEITFCSHRQKSQL